MSFIILGEPIRAADLLGIIPIGIGIYLATRSEPQPRTAAQVIATD